MHLTHFMHLMGAVVSHNGERGLRRPPSPKDSAGFRNRRVASGVGRWPQFRIPDKST